MVALLPAELLPAAHRASGASVGATCTGVGRPDSSAAAKEAHLVRVWLGA